MPTGPRQAHGNTSDLLVGGEDTWDVYTPQTSNIDRIVSKIYNKRTQANNVIVDLTLKKRKSSDFSDVMERLRGKGATNFQKIEFFGE